MVISGGCWVGNLRQWNIWSWEEDYSFYLFLYRSMTKDFDTWNALKKEIDSENTRIVHEWEIWWCSLGLNIGHEQDGKNQKYERPVLIIKKFNNSVVWTVPLSTKIKEWVYYVTIEHEWIEYSCILSQLRLTSTKRLSRYIRKVWSGTFVKIINQIRGLFPTDNSEKQQL